MAQHIEARLSGTKGRVRTSPVVDYHRHRERHRLIREAFDFYPDDGSCPRPLPRDAVEDAAIVADVGAGLNKRDRATWRA